MSKVQTATPFPAERDSDRVSFHKDSSQALGPPDQEEAVRRLKARLGWRQ
jgi:hypothetical protein